MKVALLAVFCQVFFLVGSLTTQAEEITQGTTVSQVSPTSNEVEVQSDLPKETAKEEISTEFVPPTEAPSMNEKAYSMKPSVKANNQEIVQLWQKKYQ